MSNQTISGIDFKDITSEEFREYIFPQGEVVRITAPARINISKSGGHRIVDTNGVSHYISKGWLELRWKAKEGQPAFVF